MLELAKQLNVEKTVVLGYRTSTFLKDEFEAVCDCLLYTSVFYQISDGTGTFRIRVAVHYPSIKLYNF